MATNTERPLDFILYEDDGVTAVADTFNSNTLLPWYNTDGAVVKYSEELEQPIVRESHAIQSSGAVRTFYTIWDQRFLFCQAMLGYSEKAAGDPNGGTDLTFYIKRTLPIRYHAGYHSDSGGMGRTFTNWMMPVSADIVGEGPIHWPTISSQTKYEPYYKFAKITITYAAQDFNISTDQSVFKGDGSTGDPYRMEEWTRFSKIVQRPAAKYFTPPQGLMKWVDNPPNIPPTPIPFAPSVLEPYADVWVYWREVPQPPMKAIFEALGKCNDTTFLATDDMPDGCPKETLQFVCADITRYPAKFGRLSFDVAYGFRRVVFKPLEDNTYPGHNHLFRMETVGGNEAQHHLILQRVSGDGTNSTVLGNPLVDLYSMYKLFLYLP